MPERRLHSTSPSKAGRLTRLLDILRRRGAEVTPVRGLDCVITGRQAVAATESLVCDAICHISDEASSFGVFAPTNAFGTAILRRGSSDPAGVVASAAGMASAGRRVAAFLPAGDISSIRSQLATAVERRLPLVLHVVRDREQPDGIAELTGTGAFVVVPRNAREAVDLTLVARCLAERSLTPGVVVMEGPEIERTAQDVELPLASTAIELVGAADDSIECPTPAQRMLFGERRSRVPGWFDPDRPIAHGAVLTGADLEAATTGRRIFFDAHLEPLAVDCLTQFEDVVGRPLPAFVGYRMDSAKHVIVAQGASVELAMQVADRLWSDERTRVGVLGWTWLRPAPADEIRRRLADVEVVTVLEPAGHSSVGRAPLLEALRVVMFDRQPTFVSATYRRLTAAQLAEVCGNMFAGKNRHSVLRLTSMARRSREGYPRLEALEQRVSREYEGREDDAIHPDDVLDLRSPKRLALKLLVRAAGGPERALDRLVARFAPGRTHGDAGAEAPDATGYPHARGRSLERKPELWEIETTFSAEPLRDSGDGLPADIGLVMGAERMEEVGLPFDLSEGGSLIVATDRSGRDLWADLPPAWREMIRLRGVALLRVDAEFESLIDAVDRLVRGEDPAEVVDWKAMPEVPAFERSLPVLVRRFDETDTEFDNVARFWGEYAQPLDGGAYPPAPDPYVTVGALPICSSTFRDRTPRRERHPQLDPEQCTGCGICWVSCPDSAIAPVAMGLSAILDAAADRMSTTDDEGVVAASARLRRAHPQWARRAEREMLRSGATRLEDAPLRTAYDWLAGKLEVDDAERGQLDQVFEATLGALAELPFSVPDTFFHEAERENKGSGEMLLIAFNPQACQACGICAAVCPEEAIRIVPQTNESLDDMRNLWQVWENLPDTSGATIARAAAHPRVGPLPAVLMSRHCLFSVAGGDGAERGSGGRVAIRQVAATLEFEMQRRTVERVKRIVELEGRLRDEARREVARSVALPDLNTLSTALGEREIELSPAEFVARLEEAGGGEDVDTRRLKSLTRAAERLVALREKLTEGRHAIGRARFGLVIAGSAAEWAVHFPRNPFSVPVEVNLADGGADLTLGLLDVWLARHADEIQTVNEAEALLDDRPGGDDQEPLDGGWDALTADERAKCPPLLVVAAADGLGGPELPGLSRLLSSGLPVRILLLDDRDLSVRRVDPTALGLAHRDAFVVATSIAHPRHLFDGVGAALRYDGAALVHVHAPSPARHGYSPESTIERARMAVEARVHPLLRYDPASDGAFGLCMALDDNPTPDSAWCVREDGSTSTPIGWAAGESRYDDCFVAGSAGSALHAARLERAGNWAGLREFSGLETPFTERVRRQIESELSDAHAAELAALRTDYESRLDGVEREQASKQVQLIRERLLRLSGFGRSGNGVDRKADPR